MKLTQHFMFSKVIYACIYILIAAKTKISYAALVYPSVKTFAKTTAIRLHKFSYYKSRV